MCYSEFNKEYMNIIIIGEYSGFAKHLQNGFEKLGHRAIVVENGDGYKNIPPGKDSIHFQANKTIHFGKWHIPGTYLLFSKGITDALEKKLHDLNVIFDVVVIINELFITDTWKSTGVRLSFLRDLKKQGAKIILACCGIDTSYAMFYKEERYWKYLFPDGLQLFDNRRLLTYNSILELTDCLVPISYDYKYTIERYINSIYKKTLPIKPCMLPITEEPCSINSCVGRKIVIFHGLNRPDKGTQFIKPALDKLSHDYPDQVCTVMDGRMPYEKYIKLLDSIDILIDQTNCYGISVNAALGLIKGKVVLGGNEKEEDEMRGFSSPVVNIIPDTEMIYKVLVDLISSPQKIDMLKKESRDFALKHLSSEHVAKQYLRFVNLI